MDKFEAMRVFCSVIEAGGFAPAAERMGLSTSAVSRHVAQLEAHLNVRLLNRTTRRMSPTDEGFAYFERCTQLLADLEETEASVAGEALHPRGRLRLTAPIALATLRLAPAFASFSRQYPDITLDIQTYNDYVVPNNVVEDGTVLANYFQHTPYLDDFNAEQGTHIVSVASIHVEPMGLYGGTQTTLDAVSGK